MKELTLFFLKIFYKGYKAQDTSIGFDVYNKDIDEGWTYYDEDEFIEKSLRRYLAEKRINIDNFVLYYELSDTELYDLSVEKLNELIRAYPKG